jgi:hypothetical protein
MLFYSIAIVCTSVCLNSYYVTCMQEAEISVEAIINTDTANQLNNGIDV